MPGLSPLPGRGAVNGLSLQNKTTQLMQIIIDYSIEGPCVHVTVMPFFFHQRKHLGKYDSLEEAKDAVAAYAAIKNYAATTDLPSGWEEVTKEGYFDFVRPKDLVVSCEGEASPYASFWKTRRGDLMALSVPVGHCIGVSDDKKRFFVKKLS